MRWILFLFAIGTCSILEAQSTIGLTQYDNDNVEGYILFSGVASKETYLIDKCGMQINQWSSAYKPGLSVELLPNGDLFRTGLSASSSFGTGGGKGGILEKFDWNGNLLWSFQISDADQCQHHDAIVLPNGNILAIVWERKDLAEASQAGKNPAITAILSNQEVWSEKIVEIEPSGTNSGTIVWEWKAWDHLIQDFDNSKDNFGVVSAYPELLNVNFVVQGPPTNPDWLHINSVDYNPITDEILLSSHSFGEFWIIDHSTTTSEASSHLGGNSGKGGDLLYRWGNPSTYNRGSASDQTFYKQHHATFIKPGYPNEGKVLVFNNGVNRPEGNYSSIDMVDISQAGYPYTIAANTAYLPSSLFWTYTAPVPSSFYATNISGVYPLINGSFLITDGPKGQIFEINSDTLLTWSYINPVNTNGPMIQGVSPSGNTVFRGNFYLPNYTAFNGKDLSPQGEIELNPMEPSLCALSTAIRESKELSISLFPNPVSSTSQLRVNHPMLENFKVELLDILGSPVYSEEIKKGQDWFVIEIPNIPAGIYFLILSNNQRVESVNLIVK